MESLSARRRAKDASGRHRRRASGIGLIDVLLGVTVAGFAALLAMQVTQMRRGQYLRLQKKNDLEALRGYVRNVIDCGETFAAAKGACKANTEILPYDRCGRPLATKKTFSVGFDHQMRLRCGPAVGPDTLEALYFDSRVPAQGWSALFPPGAIRCTPDTLNMKDLPDIRYWWAQGIDAQEPAKHTIDPMKAATKAAVNDPRRRRNLVLGGMGFTANWGYYSITPKELEYGGKVVTEQPAKGIDLGNFPVSSGACPAEHVATGLVPSAPASSIAKNDCVGNMYCKGPYRYELRCRGLTPDLRLTAKKSVSLFWDFGKAIDCPQPYVMTGIEKFRGYQKMNDIVCSKVERGPQRASCP
jgi:hypothetical protein